MNKKELLKEAKKRYPIRTKFQCARGDKDGVFEVLFHRPNVINGKLFGIYVCGGGYVESAGENGLACYVNCEGSWAKIISLPKSEVELLEEKYNKIEEKQKRLAAKIAELKDKYTLHLIVDDNGYLTAELSDGIELGFIDDEGMCFILNCDRHHANWELWKEHGMKVSNEVVEWRGEKYSIDNTFLLRNKLLDAIYDFEYCTPCQDCTDSNIQRHSNGTVKIF